MIRNDFVSNSSSSSFIIYLDENFELTDKLIHVLSKIPNDLLFQAKTKYSDELINSFNLIKDEDEVTCFYLDPKKLKYYDIHLIQKVVSESKEIYCNCGEDYESTEFTTQICTILEMWCNIKPQGEDHFSYSSVQNIIGDYK